MALWWGRERLEKLAWLLGLSRRAGPEAWQFLWRGSRGEFSPLRLHSWKLLPGVYRVWEESGNLLYSFETQYPLFQVLEASGLNQVQVWPGQFEQACLLFLPHVFFGVLIMPVIKLCFPLCFSIKALCLFVLSCFLLWLGFPGPFLNKELPFLPIAIVNHRLQMILWES